MQSSYCDSDAVQQIGLAPTHKMANAPGVLFNQVPANQNFHVLPRDPRELGVTPSYSF